MPLGALPHRPSRYLANLQLRATWLTERLHHLRVKTAPSHQDARSRSMTCHAGRPCTNGEDDKRSPGREKILLRSQHHHVKTVCRLWWQRVGTKTRLRPLDGLQ